MLIKNISVSTNVVLLLRVYEENHLLAEFTINAVKLNSIIFSFKLVTYLNLFNYSKTR